MRLIDADALCEDLLKRWNIADTRKEELIRAVMADIVTPIIACQPTIEPQQKTGHWISERREWEYTLRCSECGYTYTPRGLEDGTLDLADVHYYCPLCGTKMDRG